MSDRAETSIELALFAEAQAFADAQDLTISFPFIRFTPPTVAPAACWLRATLLPADSFSTSIAPAVDQHYGFFQLDVFYNQNDGEIAAKRIAAEAAVHFKFGTTLTRDGFKVQIVDVPKVRQAMKDDPWIMIPVRIPYKTFAISP